MSAILQSISDFFTFISDFFKSIFSIFNKVGTLLSSVVSYLEGVLNIFPTSIKVIFVVLLSICVIYKILGREGNS